MANTLINPAGTRWRVSETHNSRTHIYYLSVPDGAGPYFVEDILDEVPASVASSALQNHLDDTVDAHDATAVSFSPTGSVAATTVQAAIAEVDSEKVPQEGQVIGGPVLLIGNVATKTATSPTPHAGSATAINTAALNLPAGFKVQAKLLSRVDRGAVAQTVTVVLYNNTNGANVISVTSASGTVQALLESAWTDMPTPAALKEYHLESYASAANAFAVNSAYVLFRLVAA